MKIKSSDFDKLLDNNFLNIKSILIYGQDHGQILEYCKKIVSNFVKDKNDSSFIEFNYSSEEIDANPHMLFDELSSISFMMKRKIIVIKNVTDKLTSIIKDSLNFFKKYDCLLVILSDDLGTSSKLRNVFETTNTELVSMPCYIDDGVVLSKIIKNFLKDNGITEIDDDTMHFLQSNLGSDREMTKNELEKISLYMMGKQHLSLSDVKKIISDSSALQTSDLTYSIFSGKTEQALKLYPKVLDIGETPVVLIRVFLIYVKKLLSIHGSIENGCSINDALKLNAIRYYKIVPIVQNHVKLWNIQKLLKAIQSLMNTDLMCKLKESPTEILVSDLIINLCNIANSTN